MYFTVILGSVLFLVPKGMLHYELGISILMLTSQMALDFNLTSYSCSTVEGSIALNQANYVAVLKENLLLVTDHAMILH